MESNPYARVYKQQMKYYGGGTEKSPFDVENRYPSQKTTHRVAEDSASVYDIRMLPDPFAPHNLYSARNKEISPDEYAYNYSKFCKSEDTLNKRLFTVESSMNLHQLPDPFQNNSYYEPVQTASSASVASLYGPTVNKRQFSQQSLADLALLPSFSQHQMMQFAIPPSAMPNGYTSDECVNKRAVSSESAYDLQNLPNFFAGSGQPSVSNHSIMQVLRDYSAQSLEDLRHLPSFSTITLLNRPTSDVDTAVEPETSMRYLADPSIIPPCGNGCNCQMAQ